MDLNGGYEVFHCDALDSNGSRIVFVLLIMEARIVNLHPLISRVAKTSCRILSKKFC